MRYRLGGGVVALVLAAALLDPSPPPAQEVAAAQATTLQGGRAVAVSVRSPQVTETVADTGDLRNPALSPVRRSVPVRETPFLFVAEAEASVVIAAPGSVVAQVSVAALTLDFRGEMPPPTSFPTDTFPPSTFGPSTFAQPTDLATLNRTAQTEGPPAVNRVVVEEVSATSRSSCAAGSSGRTAIGSVLVNDVRIPAAASPRPNTRLSLFRLPGVTIVLNEQVPALVAGGSGLTVNAVHITSTDGFDLVGASARSDVGNCPLPGRPVVPPDPLVVEMQPDVVRRGRVATVRGSHFPASTPVQLTFDGPDLRPVEVVAGPDGVIEAALVVPRDARLGTRTVTAISGTQSATATFLLVRLPAQPPAPPFGPEPD